MLIQLAAPSEPLLSVQEAHDHLRVDSGDEDKLIVSDVAAVQSLLDGPTGILGRALTTQRWRLTIAEFPRHRWYDRTGWVDRRPHHTRMIRLPLPPIRSVEQVQYMDPTGAVQTLDPATWRYAPSLEAVVLAPGQDWPSTAEEPDAVTVDYTCGYGDTAASVPQAIRHAALLYLSHFYLNREAVVGIEGRDSSTIMPGGVETLLAGFIVHGF